MHELLRNVTLVQPANK